ncbi:HNH endonuclease [Chloroflexi bacterium TSY]|nr:HNH endonuclease [Chloroflexi bacterium TSY]
MPISQEQRQRIAQRAQHRCEYCRLHQDDSGKSHEVDHILPKKHGGKDTENNLAWSCFICNRYKGSEVGAYDVETNQLVPYFNPRLQDWDEHFTLTSGEIQARTAIGRITVRVFQFNRPDRVAARKILNEKGRYP